MELNREQIVRDLERCAANDKSHCTKCVYFYRAADSICVEYLLKDALALIRELTEENERLEAEVSVKRKLLDKCEERFSSIKADTVNKMYIEIKERCIKGGIYPAFVARTTADVAKELLEEGK